MYDATCRYTIGDIEEYERFNISLLSSHHVLLYGKSDDEISTKDTTTSSTESKIVGVL
jgi:hypothetical protein